MATEKIYKVLANLAQGLDSAEQAQARANIGAISIDDVPAYANADWDASSGEPGFIEHKPDLSIYQPVLTAGDNIDITDNVISATAAPQVNADWDASSGVAEVLNKPAEKTLVAGQNISITESGSQVTIASTSTFSQAQADWTQTSQAAVDYIKHKPNERSLVGGTNIDITDDGTTVTISSAQVNADWDATSGNAQILNKPTIPAALSAGAGIGISSNVISRQVQYVSTSHSYSYVRAIIDAGDLPVLDVANGSMHNYYVCTMMRGSDIQFVGSAYGETTLYNLASNSTWTSQILEPQILQPSANKVLAVNASGTDAEWRAIREVPTYAVADAGKLLQVVNNGGTMQLAWGQPTGYWTQRVDTSTNHSVTSDEALNGYFDEFLSVSASDTSSTITSPAFVAMTWDLQWTGGATSSRVSSIDFAIGVSGESYKALFTDTSPAHETHKDWGMTNAWVLGTRYDSIRVRVNLTGASDGDNFQLYAGGLVTQVR